MYMQEFINMTKANRKGYRFSDETVTQLNWLTKHLDTNETEVIRVSVAEKFNREWEKLPKAQLVDNGDHYDLVAQGRVLVQIAGEVVDRFPDKFAQQLFDGTADLGDVIVYLPLIAASVGEGMFVDHQAMEKTISMSF